MTSDEMYVLKPQLEAEAKRRKEAKTIERMHLAYGQTPGRECGECVHLRRIQYAKTYLKCAHYADTRGAATDWRARWDACGLFTERER